MKCKRFTVSAFTLIEIVIAIFIATLVLSAAVASFQNFSNFNRWVIHFSSLQKNALQDLRVFQKFFAGGQSLLEVNDLSSDIEEIVSRNNNSLSFQLASVVNKDSLIRIAPPESEGILAFHQGVLFGGMELVGNDLFFVETGRHIIRKIDLSTGENTIYAGQSGISGSTDALALTSTFRNPTGIAYYNGKLYVVDTGNHVIRSIVVDSVAALRQVQTVAGVPGVAGNAEGAPLSSLFSYPTGIAINQANGDIYVSDTGNHLVKKISDNFVFTFLGSTGRSGNSGTIAGYDAFSSFLLHTPTNLVFDSDTNKLFINDFENKRILAVTEGLQIQQITQDVLYYAGLRMFADDLGSKYLLFQELQSGDVYSLNILNSELTQWYSASDIAADVYAPKNLLQHAFIRHGDNLIILAFDTVLNEWQMYFIQRELQQVTRLFGSKSNYGELIIWDPTSHVFHSYGDIMGTATVILWDTRQAATVLNPSIVELMSKFLYGNRGDEQSIELSYSIVFGNDSYDF